MAPGSAVNTRTEEANGSGGQPIPEESEGVAVSAFESSPDRMVFTEDGNPDGWIATDLAMNPPR